MAKKLIKKQIKERRRAWDKQYRERHPERIKESNLRWKRANMDKFREYQRKWKKENRAKANAQRKRWAEKHPEKILNYEQKRRKTEKRKKWLKIYQRKWEKKPENRAKKRIYEKERWVKDINYRIASGLRGRLYKALVDQNALDKKGHIMELLGISLTEYRKYLEKQFQPGMSWGNWGSYRVETPQVWNIEHTIPVATFNLTNPEEQRRAFHYTNTTPMWGKENLEKGAKLIYN